MNLVDSIRGEAQKAGKSSRKMFYCKDGDKKRIRFLQDMNEGLQIVFHDSYQDSLNTPCLEFFDKDCPYCSQEGLRTRKLYAWSVWDYDAGEVKLFLYPVNQCSPIPALIALFDNYQTLLDRDYVIECRGRAKDKTMTVVPMDKNELKKTSKMIPLTLSAVRKILIEAFEVKLDGEKNDDSDLPFNTSEDLKYDGKTAKELYDMCKEKNIAVDPKMSIEYYRKKLTDADKAEDDWGDDTAKEETKKVEEEDWG